MDDGNRHTGRPQRMGHLRPLVSAFVRGLRRPWSARTGPDGSGPDTTGFRRLDREELIRKLIDADRLSPGLGRAAHVIVMSDILKEAVLRMGVAPERITILGNRVDTTLFKPMDCPNRRPVDRIELLFVGRQEPQKNVHGVLEAIRRLAAQGYRPRLSICGGGKRADFTTACLLSKGVQKFCRFLGAVRNSELPRLYARIDMLVNPSFFEGFQIPLIEALACGVPAVTSNQEPSNQIVSEQTGALVNPEDPEDIVAGILSVKRRLDDPVQRQQMRIRCRIEALTKWDFFLVSQREAEIYRTVLAHGSSSSSLSNG